jgi:hypothetical protein
MAIINKRIEMLMNRMYIKTFFLFGIAFLSFAIGVHAQDSSKRRTIDITSVFKPVLRDAVKINFHATPPITDTTRPKLTYNIPSQYLFLTYQPGELKPVALQIDSLLPWENTNYIKAGIGSVHQPYIQTGFSFGDGKNTFFNIFADQYNSKGTLPYQKNSFTDVTLAGDVKTQKNLEWNGRIGFKNDGYYLYGYRPDTLVIPKSQLQQSFQTYSGKLSLQNIEPTEFGLIYKPSITASVFSDNHNPKASETNSVLNLPLQKEIDEHFAFDLGFTADLTNYKKGSSTIQNNLFYLSPDLFVKNSNLYLQAGLTPSWDKGTFHLLPNFLADISTSDQRFSVQLGWISYYQKGSYQRYASIDPWLAQPDSLLNTRVQERYAGFKGVLNDHVTYSAKVGFQEYWNMPLFVNDSVDGKTFLLRYASSMEALQLHGEIGYTRGEEFNATVSLNINQYSNVKNQAEAWGLLPLELNATVRWEIMKDLWIKSDLWAFDGGKYLLNGFVYKGNPGFDLNAGVEFRITRQLNLWLQMNNIFNDKYERWHQYQVYGFNILGGIIFSFGQK